MKYKKIIFKQDKDAGLFYFYFGDKTKAKIKSISYPEFVIDYIEGKNIVIGIEILMARKFVKSAYEAKSADVTFDENSVSLIFTSQAPVTTVKPFNDNSVKVLFDQNKNITSIIVDKNNTQLGKLYEIIIEYN